MTKYNVASPTEYKLLNTHIDYTLQFDETKVEKT